MFEKNISAYRLLALVFVLLLGLVACKILEPLVPATKKGLVRTLQGHTGAVTWVAFSPDGSRLGSSSVDTTVRLWTVTTGEDSATLSGHPAQVNMVAFSPDGKSLASVSGTFLGFEGTFVQSEGGTPYMIPPDSETPVPLPNVVILWDVAMATELRRWEGFETGMFTVAFSPGGRILAAGSGTPIAPIDNAVRLWNISTGELEATLRERDSVWSVAFSPDGMTLASGNGNGITLWDVSTGEAIASLSSGAIRSVAYSPDGMLLASGYPGGSVRLWDMATNQEQVKLDGHDGIVYALAFSPDGIILASAGQDSKVRLWDVATEKLVATIHIPQTRMWSVAFSPDGTLLASGSSDGLIRLWDVAQVLGE